MILRKWVRGFVGTALGLAGLVAMAQSFPAKPVRLVVPYAPGGTGDLVGRILAKSLSAQYGQQVIVENRPGAGGHIGAELVARSTPDGYTLLFGAIGTRAAFSVTSNLRYDPVRDLQAVVLLCESPNILIVNPALPATTVQEFLALAKAKPKQITFGSAGNGTSTHLIGELFKSSTGVDLTHVAYKGSGPAMTDLVGGHIQAMFENLPAAVSHVKAGKVRAIALTGKARSDSLPGVPTAAESGVPGFEATSWFTIDAPRGVPEAVLRKLNEDIHRSIHSPELAPQWRELGLRPTGGSIATAADFIAKETEKWTRLVRSAGIRD
ncbi:MAG: tripartite tricarboxylate transporter substrate binding protein [Alphaproteobacteria bacterium]|nr:tripartite tricarboxylate transporter substrate binding protein [Alphaproteobacteria bacterium]